MADGNTAHAVTSVSRRFENISEDEVAKLLTEKDAKNTRRATETAITVLRAYLAEKNIEVDFLQMPENQKAETLRKFYVEIRKKNGERYQRSSLFALRHGINRYLSNALPGLDIINGPQFKEANRVFEAVTKDLKREGKGGISHHPPIDDNDLLKMYNYFDLTDNVKLQQKVFVDLMLYFGRRGRENIHELQVSDFAASKDGDGNIYIHQTRDELTKNHQNEPNSADGRMYSKPDDIMCPVKTFMTYKRHLNPKCPRLFQRPSSKSKKQQSDTGRPIWYDNSPVGHNKIGEFMPNISTSAQLSKRYTNHSLRATAVHLLDRKQFASRHIMTVTGHKAESSLKTYTGYTENSIKREMSNTISESLRPTSLNSSSMQTSEPCAKKFKMDESSSENKKNDNFDEIPDINVNSDFQLMTESQLNQILSDTGFTVNDIMEASCTENEPSPIVMKPNETLPEPTIQNMVVHNDTTSVVNRGRYMNFPIPVVTNCNNVTINFNVK